MGLEAEARRFPWGRDSQHSRAVTWIPGLGGDLESMSIDVLAVHLIPRWESRKEFQKTVRSPVLPGEWQVELRKEKMQES